MAALAVAALLTACDTTSGITEFDLYRTSFENAQSASSVILDQLAVQERRIALRAHIVENADDELEFDPGLARYYSDAVDPPATAALRAAIESISSYNELLMALANGQSAREMVERAAVMKTELLNAAQASAALVASGAGAGGAGFAAAGTALDGAIGRLMPFAELALSFRTREEFRTQLLANYDPLRALLVELRDSTRQIFPVLTAEVRRRARTDPVSGALTPAEVAKIEGYRRLLSDWVLLLDGSISALDQVTAAILADPTMSGSLAGLTLTAAQLTAAADAARKHAAELATN